MEVEKATVVQNDDFAVIVIKDGEARQIHDLPLELRNQLERYYDEEPVVGISRKYYLAMEKLLENQLVKYKDSLKRKEYSDEMFEKAMKFAQTFEVYSDESPLLFELLCWVDRVLDESNTVTSRRINSRAALQYLNRRNSDVSYYYRDVAREFNRLKKSIFGDTYDIKVGFVKFIKFYFAVNKAAIVA
jgi:hypothetical protein